MKTRSKALLVALCAVLLVVSSVLGTVAYLTSTDSVTNTFTVGNVKITLDETDVDVHGVKDGETRVKANEYHLIPGHDYIKDPTVHVDADSENCWLFVKIVDGLVDIQDTETVAAQMAAKGWALVDGTDNIYAYKEVVSANANIIVFENFTIKGDVDNDTLATYADKTIEVTAYAVQAYGFDTAAEAWTAAGLN